MDERFDSAETRDRATDEPSNQPRANAWVIGPVESDCDHGEANLRHVGDDGLTSYYRCERCGSALVFREPIGWSARAAE